MRDVPVFARASIYLKPYRVSYGVRWRAGSVSCCKASQINRILFLEASVCLGGGGRINVLDMRLTPILLFQILGIVQQRSPMLGGGKATENFLGKGGHIDVEDLRADGESKALARLLRGSCFLP